MNCTGQAMTPFPSTRDYFGVRRKDPTLRLISGEPILKLILFRAETLFLEVIFYYFTAYYLQWPSSGAKVGQMGERFLAEWGNWKDFLYICSSYKGDTIWKKYIKKG
jgi:hypothetical protein